MHFACIFHFQNEKGKGTPKQRLLGWVNAKMPDKPIKNFTTDWNDGTAIGALVDAIAPGLCPDWEDWNPKNAIKNAREALNAAQQWLDVPQVSCACYNCRKNSIKNVLSTCTRL